MSYAIRTENLELKKEIESLKEELNNKDKRISELEEAIEFACAEDMWISNGEYEEKFEYRYVDWYQDVLNNVLNKK